MSFPEDPLPIVGELFIDGAWVDVTDRLRLEDEVVINRGRKNEQGQIGSATCDFTLNNRDGLFSDRNPRSVYYHKVGRNTKMRVRVDDDGALWNDGTNGRAVTPDHSSLDITGDIDVRFEIKPFEHPPTRNQIIMAKWDNIGAQRSWGIYRTYTGGYGIFWSETGASTKSHARFFNAQGRFALRITLDVDNGAGGWTVSYYTADTINGPWTLQGTGTGTGVTSIYSSSASFALGADYNGTGIFSTYTWSGFDGNIYAVQVRDGFGGTSVVNIDFDVETEGATSFTDNAGRLFTLSGAAYIAHGSTRFMGEVASFPQEWDSTGQDVYIRTSANGITSRMTQGATPLRSPIFRYMSQQPGTIGYWPLEDDSNSETAGNNVSGGKPASLRDVSLGYEETLPASEGVLTMGGTNPLVQGYTKGSTNGNYSTFIAYFKYPEIPLSGVTLFTLNSTSYVSRWTFGHDATGIRLRGYDSDGALIVTDDAAFGSWTPDQWTAVMLRTQPHSGGVRTECFLYTVGDDNIGIMPGSPYDYSAGVGRYTSWKTQGLAAMDGVQIAHVLITQEDVEFNSSTFFFVSNGYRGELAGNRFIRLCQEEAISYSTVGDLSLTEPMGVQRTAEFMELIDEIAELEGGLIYEKRDALAIEFRTRNSLYNLIPARLSYGTDKDLSGRFVPIEDDQLLRNDVTVSRPGGSFARSVKRTGRMSILPPEDGGVGKYDTKVELNAAYDSRLQLLADQLRNLGTWDEARYPSVEVQLQRAPFLDVLDTKAFRIERLDLGDRIDVEDISPEFLPPDSARLMIQGYQETLKNRGWEFQWNTSPYGPYDLGIILADTDTLTPEHKRVDSETAVLTSTINTSVTTFNVTVGSDGDWTTDPTHFPFDVEVEGEVMEVQSITGSGTQSFTVIRAKNGIAEFHGFGQNVRVYRPLIFGL